MLCVEYLLYTDDILLLAPLVLSLQLLLDVCERELEWFDMSISVKKNYRACLLAQDLMFIAVISVVGCGLETSRGNILGT